MTNTLTQLSHDLAQTVETADSGIVRVEARRRLPASGIVWSADGHILTAHHVVRRDEKIQIGLSDGSSVAASLIGRDPTTDIAILKAEASGLAPYTEANKDNIGVGHLVLALGRPGHTVQATLGIISALGKTWQTRRGGKIDRYLQTDVVMYPGFSGGPLIGADGTLVGMNSSALLQGVSLTIPTQTLARVADSLLSHGRVRRGYLGVSTQRVRLPKPIRKELDQKSGLLVVSVEADSAAEKAGLTLGDTIVSFGGTAIHKHDDLLTQLSGDHIGQATPVGILRGGKLQQLDVVVGERTS